MNTRHKIFWTLLSIAAIGGCYAHAVTEKFLDSVAMIESSGNPNAVGDGGKAVGLFQLHRAAWNEARSVDQTIPPYEAGAKSGNVSRRAARAYFNILTSRFQRATGTPPTPGQLYAAYNIGLSRFLSKYGGDISKCPATTQRAIKKL